VRTGRIARVGSIFFVALAVVACSNTPPSTTVPTSSAGPATPSPIPSPTVLTSSAGQPTPSPIPTPSPTPSPTASPRPMTPATLKPGPALTTVRTGQAAVRLADGRVLLMGGMVPFAGPCGMTCTASPSASVEIYDPRTRKFSPNGSLAEGRSDGQALLLKDGRVLVWGGNLNQTNTMEIYDPAKKVSVVVTPPAETQYLPFDPTVALLADGEVLIAGGVYYGTISNVTLIFDPASGGYSNGPLLAEPREGATATLLDDGRVLIAGGEYLQEDNDSANNNVELLDPSHPTSQSRVLVPHDHPVSSTLLSDGRVLVAEESSMDTSVPCGTRVVREVFDPRTETFTPVGPMTTPRTGSAAIKIPDGRVILFGGVDSNCAAVGTVEAFDPDSGTFQVIATGFPKITDFSATLLDDGEILIAGGSSADEGWMMTAATWLLKP
jgi:hypothetical protein